MSIVFDVHDDRLIIDLTNTSAHFEFPLRPDGQPLCDILAPGLPPHVIKTTEKSVAVSDGWLYCAGKDGRYVPLVPTGDQGSLGDRISIVRSTPQTDSGRDRAGAGVAPGVEERAYDETRETPEIPRANRRRLAW